MDEQRIREIIREELAAHEERLKGEPEKISPIRSLKSLGLTTGQIVSSVTHMGETVLPLQVDKKQLSANLDPHFHDRSARDGMTQEFQK